MFVAVVYVDHFMGDHNSNRPEGDWASFIGDTKDEAVKKAFAAATRWEASSFPYKDAQGNEHGGHIYQILVGELTEEQKRFKLDLKALPEETF